VVKRQNLRLLRKSALKSPLLSQNAQISESAKFLRTGRRISCRLANDFSRQ
jgi:hypothetical protein